MTNNLFINAIVYFAIVYTPGAYFYIKKGNRYGFISIVSGILTFLIFISHVFVIGLMPSSIAIIIGGIGPYLILMNFMPECKSDGEAFRRFFKNIRYTVSRAKEYNDDIHYKYMKMDDDEEK